MFWNPDDAEVVLGSDVINLIQDFCQNTLSRLVFQFSDRCTCRLTICIYAVCGMEVSYPCPTWDGHVYCPQLNCIKIVSWLVFKVLLLWLIKGLIIYCRSNIVECAHRDQKSIEPTLHYSDQRWRLGMWVDYFKRPSHGGLSPNRGCILTYSYQSQIRQYKCVQFPFSIPLLPFHSPV